MIVRSTLAVALTSMLTATTAHAQTLGPELGEIQGDQGLVRAIFYAARGQTSVLKDALQQVGATLHREHADWIAATVPVTATNLEQYRAMAGLRRVELDAKRQAIPVSQRILPLAADLPAELGHQDKKDFIPWGISAVQAHVFRPDPKNPRTVCIVDSGYMLGHPDLPVTNVSGTDEGAGPWNQDGVGHGTHVAGTILALEGNGGIVGVLGDGSTRVYVVRAFSNDGAFVYASDLVGAVEDCAAAGSHVVNMSLGGSLSTEAEEEAFDELSEDGLLLIAAAGNDGAALHSYPASYDAVVSVGAVNANLQHADFSQRTAQVEVSAPGVDVLSTVGADLYAIASGTSMATPHAAGVAASVWSHFPGCSNYDVRRAVRLSAADLGEDGPDYRYGYGMVQALAAYDYLMAHGCSGETCEGEDCRESIPDRLSRKGRPHASKARKTNAVLKTAQEASSP